MCLHMPQPEDKKEFRIERSPFFCAIYAIYAKAGLQGKKSRKNAKSCDDFRAFFALKSNKHASFLRFRHA